MTPEINSAPAADGPSSGDWTKDNLDTPFDDALAVEALRRRAQGKHHDGWSIPSGVSAICGMNFQAVSTAQKLNTSRVLGGSGTGLGGYAGARQIPDQMLAGALEFVDAKLTKIVNAVADDTVVILSAKHGQSPQNRADLTIIIDGDLIASLKTAWAEDGHAGPLVAHPTDDDGVLLPLNDHSQQPLEFTKDFVWSYSGTGVGFDAAGNKISRAFTSSGPQTIYAGEEAAAFIGVETSDGRVPDVIGIAKQGPVYAGGKLPRIAKHGGDAEQNRRVPTVVRGAGIEPGSNDDRVEATQIAPTIRKLFGLPTHALDEVRLEGTRVLADLDR